MQMLAQNPTGGAGLPGFDGSGQFTMLTQRLAAIVADELIQPGQPHHQRQSRVLIHAREMIVTRPLNQLTVELTIRFDEAQIKLHLQQLFHRVGGGSQFLGDGGAVRLGEQSIQRCQLQHTPGFPDLIQIGLFVDRTEVAALVAGAKEPFMRQADHRFTTDGAIHAQLLGPVRFAQPLARRDLAVKQQRPQPIVTGL